MTTGGESLVYDGSRSPTVSSYKVTTVTSGNVYKFRVSGINRVGEGGKSPYSVNIKAATLPGKPSPP